MTDLATLGLAVDSSQVKSATTALQDFSKAGQQAQQSASGVTEALGKAKGPSADFARNFAAADAQQGNYSKSANKVIDSLSNQFVRLNSTKREWAQLSAIQKAGVDINSDAANKISGMAGALFDLEQQQKSLRAANDNSSSSLDRFANTITRRIVGLFVVNEIKNFIKYVWDLNGALSTLAGTAQRTGIGSGSLQGLQAAGGASGLDITKMLSDMVAFSQQVDLAKHGVGELGILLRANGQTVGTTEENFLKVADLVRNAASEAQKFSILQQAGLPATEQQVKFMEQGAAAIQKQIDAAKAAGLTVQQELLDKAAAFDKKWNTAWTNFSLQARSALAVAIDGVGTLFAKVEQYANRFGNAEFWKGFYTPASMAAAGITPISPQQGRFDAAFQGLANQTPNGALTSDLNRRVAQINGTTTVDPNLAKQQIALEQQRLSILGPLATVQDQVRAKQLELNAAGLNGVGVSAKQREALINLTRAQAELTQIQGQASIGVFNLGAATAQAGHELQSWIDRKLLDPTNVQQMAAAHEVLAKRIEQTRDAAKVAAAPLEGLQRLSNEAGNMRGQLDTLATGTLNGLSDGLVSIANGSATAGDAFRNFGLTVVTALEKMIVQMTIIKPLADALQSSLGGGGGLLSFLGLGGTSVGTTSATAGASSFMMGGQSFPKFANGGTLGAGWGIVGERGPELINVHSRGVTVIPNHVSRPYLPGFAEGGMLNAGGNVTRLPFGQNNNPAPTTIINNYDFRGADPSMKGWIKAQIKISQDQTLKATPGYTAKVNRDQPGMRRSG